MRPSVELKNIPISLSLLHQQEYRNLAILSLKATKRRRAWSERNGCTPVDRIIAVANPPIASIQKSRSEVAV